MVDKDLCIACVQPVASHLRHVLLGARHSQLERGGRKVEGVSSVTEELVPGNMLRWGKFKKEGIWVGKIRCMVSIGRYVKISSKSRKVEKWKGFIVNLEKSKSQKVERCHFQFRKVEKLKSKKASF